MSIKDEQQFSFLGAPGTAGNDGNWTGDVGTLAGIFGANASGKSNVLKALDFMREAVRWSYADWSAKDAIPVTPFALDGQSLDKPSLFEAVFQLGGVRYQYGFRLTGREVLGEWLYAYVAHRRQVWFERDVSSAQTWYFGKSFAGRSTLIADLTRPAALFLSAAAANNHRMAMEAERFYRDELSVAWPDNKRERIRYTQSLVTDERRWARVEELIRFADLGIREVRVRREPLDAETRARVARVVKALDSSLIGTREAGVAVDEGSDTIEFGHSADFSTANGVSSADGATPAAGHLVFLPLEAESLGTQAWFALIGPMLDALHTGGTLTIDEIDASLHPHLTSEILRIFGDPHRNPKQAQLLFTSHDTTLMGGLLGGQELVRDQVWFTEKRPNGATNLYPLTDFSPRSTEHAQTGYLQGRYGA